jgi:hypothetical protein
MAPSFSHQPMQPTAALVRRLREYARRLQSLVPGLPQTDRRLLDHLCATFVKPMPRAKQRPPIPETGDRAASLSHSGISERNGIWVLTIGGVWHGDYRKREHAEEASERARAGGR